MKIMDFLTKNRIVSSLQATTKEQVLAELVERLALEYPRLDKHGLIKTLIERENLGSTGIGGGIAIPHGKFDGLNEIVASFGRSEVGVDFNAMDERPAYLFFLLVAPKNSAGEHLKALAKISRLFKDPLFKDSLRQAQSTDDIYQLIEEFDIRCA